MNPFKKIFEKAKELVRTAKEHDVVIDEKKVEKRIKEKLMEMLKYNGYSEKEAKKKIDEFWKSLDDEERKALVVLKDFL